MLQDSPGVGAHMLEHRLLMMEYRLARPISRNAEFRGLRLARNVARYYLTRSGPMAEGGYEGRCFRSHAAGFADTGCGDTDGALLAFGDAIGWGCDQRNAWHAFVRLSAAVAQRGIGADCVGRSRGGP
ncbi:MAG: hypothetical protein WDN04_03260 [Rhodospirillales bacterium]